MSDLQRFKDAQKMDFDIALAEIQSGRKRSHWMWYISVSYTHLDVYKRQVYERYLDSVHTAENIRKNLETRGEALPELVRA